MHFNENDISISTFESYPLTFMPCKRINFWHVLSVLKLILSCPNSGKIAPFQVRQCSEQTVHVNIIYIYIYTYIYIYIYIYRERERERERERKRKTIDFIWTLGRVLNPKCDEYGRG